MQRALEEDLGRAGDVTSIATIPEPTRAHAIMVARQAGVIAGLPLAVATFQKLSPDLNIEAHVRDQIAGYKVPRRIWLVDAIQRTAAGKADYRWAQQYAATHPSVTYPAAGDPAGAGQQA